MTCYRKSEPLPPGLVWVPGMPTFSTEADCGNECPDCAGACCHPDGTCTEETKAACDAAGGTWLGVGVDCADANCPQQCPGVPGCCAGGEVIACYQNGVEVPCEECGHPGWGYKVGETMWNCWAEPDAAWCQAQEAGNPAEWRFLDNYCTDAFYSDYQGLVFPVADCPETAALYGPDTLEPACDTPECNPGGARTGTLRTGSVTVQFRGLTAAEAQKLKTENPLP